MLKIPLTRTFLAFSAVTLAATLIVPPPARSAPSGAGWTAIIVGGTIVLYEFGYRLPSDNVKIKGAWREAQDVTDAQYDANALMNKTFPLPSRYPDPTGKQVQITDQDGTTGTSTRYCSPVVAKGATHSPGLCAYDADAKVLTVYYSALSSGSDMTLKDLRAMVVQSVIATQKTDSKVEQWRDRYENLRACWNRLVYVDPTPSPKPSTSASPSEKPSPTASKQPKKSTQSNKKHNSGGQGGGHNGGGHTHGGQGGASKTSQTNGVLAAAPSRVQPPQSNPSSVTPVAKPSPSATPVIPKSSCAYGIEGVGASSAPAIIDSTQLPMRGGQNTASRVVYVDLRDAASAFETTDSLQKQIVDRHVGPNTIANLERAEILAQLAGIYYSDFNPDATRPIKVQFPTPAPSSLLSSGLSGGPSRAGSTSSSTSNPEINAATAAYGSCVAKFSLQDCYSAISGPEATIAGTIATKNACAFASDYWLPTVSAIGVTYGANMKDSVVLTSPSPPTTDDIEKAKFSDVPGC